MKRAALKLVLKTFADWLSGQFPPAGKPAIHDLVARGITLIDAIPSGQEPDVNTIDTLDEAGVEKALNWLFTALTNASIGDPGWTLCLHSLRLLMQRHVVEIARAVVKAVPIAQT